jgi:hypothetical protein
MCETCGAEFTPSRNDARYCSSACRQKAYRSRNAPTTALPTDLGDRELFARIFAYTHPPMPWSRPDLVRLGRHILLEPTREPWQPEPDGDPFPGLTDGQLLGQIWDKLATVADSVRTAGQS